MSLLSVVLPAYNEEKMIDKAADTIASLLEQNQIEYEILFVDDGSKDGTWERIEAVTERKKHIVGIHFSRNFGKEAAIFAGLKSAQGDCCVVMDCDLQHPPETILPMYQLWTRGFEIVEGVKRSRGKESILHKASAGLFYKMISKAVKIDMTQASDFKLMDRKVVDQIVSLNEKNAFFRALSSWVGFEKAEVEFDVREREEGESKWSTWSLIKYAITNIVAFSSAPMQFVTLAGVIFFFVAIGIGIQTLVKYFMGQAVEGFTTVILLLLMTGSLLMISLGIIGYYISKIYEEVKGRPRYIVSKEIRK